MKKLFYLSSGSSKWGSGHLRRSDELINVLRNKGINVNTIAVVPDNDEMKRLSSFVNVYDRYVQSLNEIGGVDAEGIVVDVHTDFQYTIFPWIQSQRCSVVALDWYYDTGKNIIAMANLRGGAEALKYAIVRKEFHEAYKRRLRPNSGPEYDAVVMMGGGDKRGYLPKVLKLFTEDECFSNRIIIIVLGPMVEGKLTELVGHSMETISILRDPDNIADIMANATVGITNGGTSLMEFTMLGIPTLLFPQSEEEDDFIKSFLETGCSIMGTLKPREFAIQIMELWENEMLRKTMSERAIRLIDGHGVERISDLILKSLFLDNK